VNRFLGTIFGFKQEAERLVAKAQVFQAVLDQLGDSPVTSGP